MALVASMGCVTEVRSIAADGRLGLRYTTGAVRASPRPDFPFLVVAPGGGSGACGQGGAAPALHRNLRPRRELRLRGDLGGGAQNHNALSSEGAVTRVGG